MAERTVGMSDLVEAIVDLTKITVAFSGKCETKSDAIRRLAEVSIPPARIAAILSMSTKDVTSVIAKDAKDLARASASRGGAPQVVANG